MAVIFGAAYLTLCALAALSLFPSSDSSEDLPSKVQSAHDNSWHRLFKKGARPRNIFFSSEGQMHETDTEQSNFDDTSNSSRKFVKHALLPNDSSTLENNFRPTELSDIFIGLKTTEKYHESRLLVLFETWLERPDIRAQVRPITCNCFKGSGHYWLLLIIIISIKPILIWSNGERLVFVLSNYQMCTFPLMFPPLPFPIFQMVSSIFG